MPMISFRREGFHLLKTISSFLRSLRVSQVYPIQEVPIDSTMQHFSLKEAIPTV